MIANDANNPKQNPDCHERPWQQYRRDFPDNYTRHLAHGDVSVDAYMKANKVALGQRVAKKRRIYLDTKYWIYCLDALSGRPQQPIHAEIAKTLAQLVEAGNTICPAHYALFTEMRRIGCPERRRELAKLVDWFSTKVTIVPPHVQQQSEFLYLVRSYNTKKEDLHPVAHLIWEPISAVLGMPIPELPGIEPDVQAALQKDWCDLMSGFGLEDLFAEADDDLPSPLTSRDGIVEYLNAETAAHRNDYRSFDEAFQIEVQGVLDAMRPQIASGFQHLYVSAGHTLTEQDIKGDSGSEGVRQFCALILEAYKQKKLSTQWPSLHIGAGIHAAIRYEQRQYQPGDMSDHMHAKAALPYCNMFLTERVLGTLITGKYLRFHEQYACKVLWRDRDVLEALQEAA